MTRAARPAGVRREKPDPKLWPESEWPRCAICGFIRGATDPLAAAALYSVAIESPQLSEVLCQCDGI